jgi:uncharacterized protein
MKINIQKSQLSEKYGPYLLLINNRLPKHIEKVDRVFFYYTLEKFKEYFILILEVNAELIIECQRCLQNFEYNYRNVNNFAICKSEAVAEKLMNDYEPIVSMNNELDLLEIITDDLHLFCPEVHVNLAECTS